MSGRSTRRELFGASAALLLVGSAGAGQSKAAELDGRLLAMVRDLEAVQVRIEASQIRSDAAPHNAAVQLALDDELDGLQGEFWPLADAIAGIPARTPEGIQAKARAARLVHGATAADTGSPIARHLHGLVRDITGEG